MTHQISFTVNETEHELEVSPDRLLVHVLRENLGYTGTNIGCETSLCGACTVHVDGKAIKSCTMLAVQADGADVRTVEGLATGGEMHPLQESFKKEHGLQCGYCTPGMMMASLGLLQVHPDPSRDEIRHALAGNLCRCTGYQNIVNAVEVAAERMAPAATDGGTDVD